jgi:hypothetical protein
VGFACACCEHVLPLYEGYYALLRKKQQIGPKESVREALNLIWEFAFGIDIQDIARIDSLAAAAIPRIDVDRSIQAEMGMAASVCVLEALDSIDDNKKGAADRASSNALKAVMVACFIKSPRVDRLQDPFPALFAGRQVTTGLEPLISVWGWQNELLDSLSSSQVPSLEWKQTQSSRGAEMAAGLLKEMEG